MKKEYQKNEEPTSVLGGRREANMADSAPLSMVSGPLWLLKVCHSFILKSVSQFYLKKCVTIVAAQSVSQSNI